MRPPLSPYRGPQSNGQVRYCPAFRARGSVASGVKPRSPVSGGARPLRGGGEDLRVDHVDARAGKDPANASKT